MSLSIKGAGSEFTGTTKARPERPSRAWTVVTAIEVAAASAAVLLDFVVPTLVLLAMTVLSLIIRRKHFSSLGFHRVAAAPLVVKMLAFAAAWSVLQLGVFMPIANNLSGRETDLSDFKDLQGNTAMLAGLLVLSWT